MNWLHCLSIGNVLVMHLISENSQISTSSRFRNSSGYVFNFIAVISEAGNETPEKFGVILALNKSEERSEK